MGKVIGIDLGTTNSCVALYDNGEPQVVANSEGARTAPSIVAFAPSGEKLVGHIAKRQAVTNPEHTIFAVKRLIGRKFDSEEVQSFAKIAPFAIQAAENGDAWVDVGDSLSSPQEISAMILVKMKETAAEFLGEPVADAVITVPAYFDDSQRQATQDAGRIAGLNVLRIINEPTAAALAYGVGEQEEKKVAVFDLGGGTFDISILALSDGVFEVLSTNGDTFLGGEDFDLKIVDHLIAGFEAEHDVDLRQDNMARQRLKETAERAKHELSSAVDTDINLPFIAAADDGPKHLTCVFTRDELEVLCEGLIERLVGPCETALADAGLTADQIDNVILVGGMTRMPAVEERVRQIFGQDPDKSVNPDEVVAAGAAIQAGVLTGEVENVLLLDVTPLSLGVETQGGISTHIIERNTTVPTSKSQVFSTTEDNQTVVRVHVLQGERELAVDNKTLGRFELVGIPPAPRGVPQIQVTFDINADGVVNVSAMDLGTGQSQAIQVTASSGLDEQQIERLIEEAQENVEADQQRREWIEAANKADGLVYSTERTLEEFAENIVGSDREQLLQAVEVAKEVMKSEDLVALKAAVDELSALTYNMTEKLYAALGGGEGE
ncbi:MAG: molecular chaperone DnaK [Deltaproteobacteria bacterium]|nr:molecular chaperone DnaK [Deltaproteobacteria bacterium]MBW2359822.1 molecular chaperone DnaK [Deltaproteobacteria bacterium]